MSLIFQIEGATQLDKGMWKASLSPSEISLFNTKTESAGHTTVIFLLAEPKFDAERHQLTFDPSAVRLLNAGTSDHTILIEDYEMTQILDQINDTNSLRHSSGDAKFISSLPSHIKELGSAILTAVRNKYSGNLVYKTSGKYVEAPDNFWTIRPQPRDESFRITVRGRPESFENAHTFQIKADMPGYSSFKIERIEQIDDFIRILAQVRRK